MNIPKPYNPDLALFVARLFLGGIFLIQGYDKLTNMGFVSDFFSAKGFPSPDMFTAAIIILELLGGALVLFGFFTRTGAALVALDALAIFFLAVLPQGISVTGSTFSFVALAFGLSVSFIFIGGGEWSLFASARKKEPSFNNFSAPSITNKDSL